MTLRPLDKGYKVTDWMKMDLATVEPSIRWLQLLYGTPQMYATRKWVTIKNVGEHVV